MLATPTNHNGIVLQFEGAPFMHPLASTGQQCQRSNCALDLVLLVFVCLQMALLMPVLMSVVWTGPAHAAKKSRQV